MLNSSVFSITAFGGGSGGGTGGSVGSGGGGAFNGVAILKHCYYRIWQRYFMQALLLALQLQVAVDGGAGSTGFAP
jgi:hypothetical protein